MTARDRMLAFLAQKANGATPSVEPTPTVARRLLDRTAQVPFFAHSYAFVLNMDHGSFTPADLAEFAQRNALTGLCLHINDGNEHSLAEMDAAGLDRFRRLLADLGLKLHLEISSTERAEVDRVVALAEALAVTNIRLYARHEGPLDRVIATIRADLLHVARRARATDLCFDYEQHEDLRADEIAGLLIGIDNPRIGALFDYTNSWNAHEEPLAALRVLAPWIRQAHIKGGRKSVEGTGWGQLGVPQGSREDELPAAMLLYELLLLGDDEPQVIALALESEVGYYAPPFRHEDESANPTIAWRTPSQTNVGDRTTLGQRLIDERRWAEEQVDFNRALVAELRSLATEIVAEATQTEALGAGRGR